MTDPGPGALAVELNALRGDARIWGGAAGSLAGPAGQVGGLAVPSPAFSFFATERGLDVAYEELRGRVQRLLTEGQVVLADLGRTLGGAADTYEREDRAGAHAFDGLRPGG